MNTIEGFVEDLRFSTSITGGEKGTSTTYLAIFSIKAKPIEIRVDESIILANGDEVMVAGDEVRGLFRAKAYFNKTQGVKGRNSTVAHKIVGIGFCLSIFLLPFGIWLLLQGRKIDAAFELINQ